MILYRQSEATKLRSYDEEDVADSVDCSLAVQLRFLDGAALAA
jgi:hypothetical protein